MPAFLHRLKEKLQGYIRDKALSWEYDQVLQHYQTAQQRCQEGNIVIRRIPVEEVEETELFERLHDWPFVYEISIPADAPESSSPSLSELETLDSTVSVIQHASPQAEEAIEPRTALEERGEYVSDPELLDKLGQLYVESIEQDLSALREAREQEEVTQQAPSTPSTH